MSTTSSPALPSLALLAVMASGCLTLNPAGQAKANGAPLAVEERGSVRFLQGRALVDEQDFYAIAGDAAAVRQVRGHRNDLIATQIAGQAAGAGGIGGVVLGGAALAGGVVWTAQDGPIGLLLLLPGSLLFMASVVAIPVGYAMAADAADELSWSTVLPPERARAAAARYNKRRRR